MLLQKGKSIALIIGSVLLPATVAGALFVGSTNSFQPLKADAYSVTLNNNIQPTLDSSGAGTLDIPTNLGNDVTWEYSNAQDYASGHVALKNGGYFGVSSASTYSYTGISNITINFTAGSDGELWLLKSLDGITWHECSLLKDVDKTSLTTASSSLANNWRYIRFWFDYDSNNTPLNINSVIIDYGCSGISATEDVDMAKMANVRDSKEIVPKTASIISPLSVGGEAVEFGPGISGDNSYVVFSFPKIDSWHDIYTSKIEFDYY